MATRNQQDAATELALALGLLVRRIRSAAPSELQELSWTQKAVLARLDAQGSATIADLARAESVKPQSMGTAVAALEQVGLVERKPHPTDGRQVNIELTARGAAMRKSTGDAKRTWLAQAIEKLGVAEQKRLPAVTALIKRLGES